MTTELRFAKPVFKDYYLILQVHPGADGAMVDAAYWHLARRYSDAAFENPSAKRKLDDLNAAYSVLGSSARRVDYDRLRADVLGEGALPMPPEAPLPPQPLAIMDRQRPRPREETAEDRRTSWFRRLPAFRVPAWQNALAALVIILLGGAGLATQLSPAFVVGLLFLGLALTSIPLVRRIPMSATPSFAFASPKLPSMDRSDDAIAPGAKGDSERLRRSTAATIAQMRINQASAATRDDAKDEQLRPPPEAIDYEMDAAAPTAQGEPEQRRRTEAVLARLRESQAPVSTPSGPNDELCDPVVAGADTPTSLNRAD